MLRYNPKDMEPTPQDAITAAKADPDFVLLLDDLVLRSDGRDPAFEGYYTVVSKTVLPQHWEDRWTCVGRVKDFNPPVCRPRYDFDPAGVCE